MYRYNEEHIKAITNYQQNYLHSDQNYSLEFRNPNTQNKVVGDYLLFPLLA